MFTRVETKGRHRCVSQSIFILLCFLNCVYHYCVCAGTHILMQFWRTEYNFWESFSPSTLGSGMQVRLSGLSSTYFQLWVTSGFEKGSHTESGADRLGYGIQELPVSPF